MSTLIETPTRTFLAGGALDQFSRVVLSSGKLAAAGADEREIGTVENPAFADGDAVAVRLNTAQGTCKMVANGAITQYAQVFGAASGKVSATGNGNAIGIALSAAGADEDIIEVLRMPISATGQNVVIEHHTASDTLTKEESGSVHTNLGAAGAITLTLPQDAPKGCTFKFLVMTAQALQIDPGAAGAIYIGGAKGTDDKYISADDEAECVVLTADGNGDWIAGPSNGTWSAEGA